MITMPRGWEDEERSALYASCSRDHGSNMSVRTTYGGAYCLECFTDLIASPSSLVVHREKALDEFTEALKDSQFCDDLVLKRPEVLAAPLAEAIVFTDDEVFGTAIINAMVTTCKLALDTLLQDSMLHICSHLSRSETTAWKHGHLFSVHALGLLLELHCRHYNHIPNAITSQAGCVDNLVKAVTLPTDEMGVDIFFVLFKLTSLEGGIQLLVEYCPSLVFIAVRALEKTQSDDVRTSSLDLLIALAQASVFNISLSTAAFQGQRDTNDQDISASPGQTCASFVEQFAEAMKASLLSSDTQVQIRSLVLIDQICPTSLDIGEELHYLVKEGLTDYIFEVLRVSGDLEAVGVSAIQTLMTLSMDSSTFSAHFSLGLEPLLRVLEHSFTSAFGDLQKDTLIIISAGISDRPGVIICPRAEHLISLLKKSYQRYRSIIKNHQISDTPGFGLSPEGLNVTCGTLISLLRAPSCCNVPSICPILQECVSALIDCISADPIYASQHNGLMSAANLLQEAHFFCVQQNSVNEQFRELAQLLMTHFQLRMLPVITATWESIIAEETMNTLFSTVKKILQDGEAMKAGEFARALVSQYWVSMAFGSMSKFPSEDLKQNVYSAIGTIINRISSYEELIEDDILHHLPADMESLLILLEQRSHEDVHLIVAHRAIIALLFITTEYGDRLVESKVLLSSLEQHLLVNASTSLLALPNSPVLKQFFLLFIEGQENTISEGRFRSIKAENIMLDILQEAYISGYFSYKLPVHAFKWIMKKESIFAMSKDILLKNLDAGVEVHPTIAQLIHEDDYVIEVLMSLFLDVVERHLVDEIRTVATGISSIIKGSWSLAKKFHSHGVVSTLRRFILLQGCKAPETTVSSCVELLFQVLVVLEESMAVMDEGAWLDIASQTEKLLLIQLNKGSNINISGVPLVNLVALMMHKSIRIPTIQEAAIAVYGSYELRDAFERNIVNASQKGSALTTMDINSEDGMRLETSLLFHTLWLRCIRTSVRKGTIDRIERNFSEDLSEKTSSRISYQHLCQLICFSSHSIQILTSSCLVEHLSHVTDSFGMLQGNLAECSVNHLRSVTSILQGAALESAGLLRKNACICMMMLLATTALSLKQKEAITSSPWYKTVAEELLLSLAHRQASVTDNKGTNYSASILSAILCVSPPYKWLPSVFNSQVLTAAVENFKTTQYATTAATVDFFLELLKRGFLDRNQIELLRDQYQAVRRKCYREGSTLLHVNGTLDPGANCQPFMENNSNLGATESMDSSTLIMHLALNDTSERFLGLCDDAQSTELNNASLLLVKIDEFLQRTVFQT